MDLQTIQHQEILRQAIRLGPSRIVKPDARVSSESVFSDAVWRMAELVTTPGIKASRKEWDFSRVPGFPQGFALSLAEYAFGRLRTPVATHEREGAWLTVHNELTALAEFARFCSHGGLHGFEEVDTTVCTEYLKRIQLRKSADRVKRVIGCLYRLWEYRSVIGNSISTMPFGKSFKRLFKRQAAQDSPQENATPVIPEPVYAALMSAALDYVLTHSTTILETWLKLQAHWDQEIAQQHLSQSGKRKRLEKAAASIIVDKAAWLANGWSTYGDVYTELHRLRAACITVIFAFSGIRISELLALEAGCYVRDECEDGNFRYYINTVLHKHREKGSRDTWVVVKEVVQAIKVLEVLTARARAESADNRLMLSDGTNHFFGVHRVYVDTKLAELTIETIGYEIRAFHAHCNTKLNRPPIPEWTDENAVTAQWHFNTRQFRRTLARHIVRQPFGMIAGMLQYKHVEVAAFQGYAGSDPDWNKLLEQEKVLASVDILEEVAMDMSNGQLAGEFGIKLKEEFAAEFRGRAEDFPPSQIAKWLANGKKALFVGKFNFCFFDPAKALCTPGGNSDRPILNFCQPEECGNACVGKRHIPKWQAQLKQAEELASHPKAPPFQRESLLREVERLQTVVIKYGK